MQASAFPRNLQYLVDGYRWDRTVIGHSDAEVYHLTAKDRPSLFVKVRRKNNRPQLKPEADRLVWLRDIQIAAPSVVSFCEDDGFEWLLITAVSGRDAVQAQIHPANLVRLLANALRHLHAMDALDCPFDETLNTKIDRAEYNVAAGLVDETNFDDDHIGSSATELFERLVALKPDREDPVVSHGDACLPNFMIDDEQFAGFIDCGSIGRADRYQDLALVCRSIERNLGSRWTERFMFHYGAHPVDPAKMYFYRLLDEFF